MRGLAIDHLLLRLGPINRALRGAVERQRRIAADLDSIDLSGACITDEHVATLLERTDRHLGASSCKDEPSVSSEVIFALTSSERQLEEAHRAAALQSKAPLPLDRLRETLGLTSFEEACVLICAAPEIYPAYAGIFAYLLDDVHRRHPCPELLCRVGALCPRQELALRPIVGPFGRLRRSGLLQSNSEDVEDGRACLRLAPGGLEFLLGAAPAIAGLWLEPDELMRRPRLDGKTDALAQRIERLAAALKSGVVTAVGVWGRSECSPLEVAAEIARGAELPLHHVPIDRCLDEPGIAMRAMREALIAAAAEGAIIEVQTDELHELPRRPMGDWIAEILGRCAVPTLLVGREPWRPTRLLAQRGFGEILLEGPDFAARCAMWSGAAPEIGAARVSDVAGRFHLSVSEVHAAARVARTGAELSSNGRAGRLDDALDESILTVARKNCSRFLCLVKPRRGPDDLVLPADLHRQVVEVAHFTRALPRVSESWGFGRLATGGDGLKVLLTGDPGVGKTLACECIARLLGVPLLKVSLGQVVSKWVGETSKQLDEAFEEASSNHALLFFDEADALFGKRGELRYGVDRYANTEVSHLLQRLEMHDGLVILASNLKENIDPAFMRRFHVTIHFPRPAEPERRRIWHMAFPAAAPLRSDVDLDAMARLDLTGAGIVAAARTAAFLAVDEDAHTIDMTHVVRGIARQYRRESRVLKPAELGRFATLLQERG